MEMWVPFSPLLTKSWCVNKVHDYNIGSIPTLTSRPVFK